MKPFQTVREVSNWFAGKDDTLLGSIWTVLKQEPLPNKTRKVGVGTANRILNRKTLPTKDHAKVDKKTKICKEEKGLWGRFQCSEQPNEEGHTNRTQWILGCKSPHCDLCRRAYATKRARESWGRGGDPEKSKGAFRYLNSENKIPWWYIVLTFPENTRKHITQETVKECRDAFWKAFSEFALNRQGLDDQKLTLGGSHVFHPVGDKKDEGGEEVFHPHLNFIIPGVTFGEYESPDGKRYAYKRLKMWMYKYELKELRRIWKGILTKVFNVRIRTDVVLNVLARGIQDSRGNDSRSLREQKHCLKYNFRSFPGWPTWTRRITNYGFLAPRSIGKYRETWEAWESTEYREEMACDKCGSSIEIETDGVEGASFLPCDPDDMDGTPLFTMQNDHT